MAWNDIKRVDDHAERVTKFVFSNESAVAEAVLYRYPTYGERTVICISTQSGCPVGCRFCGAGDAFVRSLSADEGRAGAGRPSVGASRERRDCQRQEARPGRVRASARR